MTYPGFAGQPGPPPNISTVGWQVRQSRAGKVASSENVISSMGTYAPPLATAALLVNAKEEGTDDPFTIEGENFELDFDQATRYGADTGTAADYTGRGGL